MLQRIAGFFSVLGVKREFGVGDDNAVGMAAEGPRRSAPLDIVVRDNFLQSQREIGWRTVRYSLIFQ